MHSLQVATFRVFQLTMHDYSCFALLLGLYTFFEMDFGRSLFFPFSFEFLAQIIYSMLLKV